MQKVIIYQDDETKVEMYKPFADQLSHYYNTQFKVTTDEIGKVLKTVMHLFSLKGWNILDGIVVSSKIPILNRGKIFELDERYEPLEDALILLTEHFDNTKGPLSNEQKQEIADAIEYYYKTENETECLIHFFCKPLYRIDGVMAIHNGKEILCLPLCLNDTDKYIPLYKAEQD